MNYYNLEYPVIYDIKEQNALHNAVEEAERFFAMAMYEEYRDMPDKMLLGFIDACFEKLNPHYQLQLLLDKEGMPTDCYIDVAYKPSYALLACCIFAALEYGEAFLTEARCKSLKQLFQGCMGRQFMDHGYEMEEGRLLNLQVLCRAGLGEFIRKYPFINREAEQFLTTIMRELELQYKHAVDSHQEVKIFGFKPIVATEQYRQLLKLYDRERFEKL